MKLLLIEGSDSRRRAIHQGLTREGHAVDQAADSMEGLTYAQSYDYDIILLDLDLPRRGFDVLARLRDQGAETHILVLSARDDIASRVHGLDLGADDYLGKPFAFEELMARLRALGRRRFQRKNPRIHAGSVEIDTVLRRAVAAGTTIPLTAKEYELVEYLAVHPGRVFSQRELIDHLHDSSTEVGSNVIEVLVYSIKNRFKLMDVPRIIKNKRNQGYYID
ncbi:MAG: response regulator transcription factor [Geminicoccaceae bacterium]